MPSVEKMYSAWRNREKASGRRHLGWVVKDESSLLTRIWRKTYSLTQLTSPEASHEPTPEQGDAGNTEMSRIWAWPSSRDCPSGEKEGCGERQGTRGDMKKYWKDGDGWKETRPCSQDLAKSWWY